MMRKLRSKKVYVVITLNSQFTIEIAAEFQRDFLKENLSVTNFDWNFEE